MKSQIIYGILLFLLCSCQSTKQQEGEEKASPNIVIIIADDIGYSDLGCYGSEIQTPHLDELASRGMRFRNFYNMAKCNPTRSSMITGLYAGDERAISFVSLLKDAGYATLMSGKEHFDKWVPPHCYFANTFDHSLTFWATTEYFVPPADSFQRPFYLEGEKIEAQDIEAKILPKYKTDFITDYALKWLDEANEKDDKPFFLLLPYHSAHYPLQARPDDIEKYKGKYLTGWDEIRQKRFDNMKRLGILPEEVKLSPPESNTNRFRGASHKSHPDLREKFPKYVPWNTLTEQEKMDKDLEMAVFAAMVDRMDQNIGRVMDNIKASGEWDNTVIMFFTDNGSCPFDSNVDFDIPPGPADSYRCLSPPWANVGNTPYRLYKQNGHEGGAKTHFIVHYPDMIRPDVLTDVTGHVVDIFPTVLDLAGLKYPDKYFERPTLPLEGRSLLPAFMGEDLKGDPVYISGTNERFRMFRHGDWKIVKQNAEDWELYNLASDPTELNDRAGENPGMLETLIEEYDRFRVARTY